MCRPAHSLVKGEVVLFRTLSQIGLRIGKPPGWERIVRLLCSPESIRHRPPQLLALRDEPLIVADPRTPLGWHLLLFGSYEPDLRVYFRSFLRPGFVVVDVGANVGWHTLLMAQCVGNSGRVIAFEPNPSVRERLQYHVSLNRFHQVEVLPYALSDQAGCVQFNAPPADDPHSGDGCMLTTTGSGGTNCIEVEAISFDSLLDRLALPRFDLIKIDVEGFEWPTLLGCEQAITRYRPHIVFEFDKDYVVRCGGSRDLLREFFHRHRYQIFVSRRWGLELARNDNWPASGNLWAVPLS